MLRPWGNSGPFFLGPAMVFFSRLWMLMLLLLAWPAQAANWCSYQRPAAFTGNEAWWNGAGANSAGGISNPYSLWLQAKAAYSTPFYFNADVYGIVCSSFPSAGGGTDPLISQAAAIAALQATDVGLQSQLTAISPWAGASAAEGAEMRMADMFELWYVFLGVGVVVLCLKAIYNVFRIPNHVG